ncbi:hypothetical protein COCSUDRAFT_52293 [Coccomyxa subellipsoidea C-169]|uniref:Uncharacterized protein n=1 Tax=Coccomyxa subellipsoidea (strain C-169) TaxID=574566 RepID=I0Z6N1_COCSC|nr:hypothetical protein COCSUDRAFT_52293 [Coccomyxa subellipsoidea C-169]EIE26300.1 hypothetical protein COCSUDRAFT_52293 [Coccomyxa subellipsoidea C-169]|eukprot:XP_005650844.1 hypothetical protein COCSUDRAFT_52293 [Coccomyxa subellipsoidea C-169]
MGNTGKKRGRDGAAGDDLLSGTKWARMNAVYGRFAPFRDASMDRWHRKTMLMTGSGALRNNLRALNQSLSSQVAALVTDSGPAVQRTQLMTAQIRPLMGRASAQGQWTMSKIYLRHKRRERSCNSHCSCWDLSRQSRISSRK